MGAGFSLVAAVGPPGEAADPLGGTVKARHTGPAAALGPSAVRKLVLALHILASVPDSSPLWPLLRPLGLA